MHNQLDEKALAQLFESARTYNEWTEMPVSEPDIRRLYDLLKWGPTSGNSSPARFVWVVSRAGRDKLASFSMEANQHKIRTAPLTVIVGYDLDFPDSLPRLFPARGELMQGYFRQPGLTEPTAMRNGSLQGGYLILAARALGFDCGPMSGFDNAAVDAAFFAGTSIRSNFICSIGYGKPGTPFPRNPRLTFEEAGRFG